MPAVGFPYAAGETVKTVPFLVVRYPPSRRTPYSCTTDLAANGYGKPSLAGVLLAITLVPTNPGGDCQQE